MSFDVYVRPLVWRRLLAVAVVHRVFVKFVFAFLARLVRHIGAHVPYGNLLQGNIAFSEAQFQILDHLTGRDIRFDVDSLREHFGRVKLFFRERAVDES